MEKLETGFIKDKDINRRKYKFGLFVHYGLYSLCGGVWNGKPITFGYSEQILSHGKIPKQEYEDLKNKFTCKKFDAEKICLLAKNTGMEYVLITAKHHDGFCLFNTKTTRYNSPNSAAGRDLIKELSEACKKYNLGLGIYFSWIDWNYPYALPISDHNSDKIPSAHQKLNIAQLTELFTNYGDLCELWMDMGKPTKKQSEEIKKLAQNLQPKMMINGRIWNDCGDFCTMGDNKLPSKPLNVPWQTPASIYHETWGYRSWQKRTNQNEKAEELINSIIQVTAMGGSYLLNVGPKGDGSIVKFEEEILKKIGDFFREQKLSTENCIDLCKKRNLALPEEKIIELKDESNTIDFAQKLYRFTGGDYYSSKFICTELKAKIKISTELKEKKMTILLARKKILKTEEGLQINGKEFCFSADKKEITIFQNIKPEKQFEISVCSKGNPLIRKALRQTDIFLKIQFEN